MITVNTLIQAVFEFVSMTGDIEAVEGTYLVNGLKCLNRAISESTGRAAEMNGLD